MHESCRAAADREPCPESAPLCGESSVGVALVGPRSLAQLIGFEVAETALFDHACFATRQVHEGQVLTYAGDACRALYIVRSGLFKSCMLDSSGCVQGLGFPMAGDMIGVDGLASGEYGSDATALESSEVVMIPVDHMMQLSRDDSSVATLFYRLIGREIVRDQSILFLLGSLSAEARVATFLLDLSDRHVTQGHARSSLPLPMTRRDIADYLGLKIETVSRTLSALARNGILRVYKRQVDLLDVRRLREIASGSSEATRGRPIPRLQGAAVHEYALAA